MSARPRRAAFPAAMGVVFAVLAASGAAAQQSGPSDGSPGYAQRLVMVTALGRRYPGYTHWEGGSYRAMGLWGGIALQTAWQQASGRDGLELWSRLNEALTVRPFQLAKAYEKQRLCWNDEICQVWRRYFRKAAPATHVKGLPHWLDLHWLAAQPLLWVAHAKAVEDILVRFEYRLEKAFEQTPAAEAHFWRGWVRTVRWLAATSPPTFDAMVGPISEGMFPDCSPLGEPGCLVADLEPPVRRLFTATIIARGVPDHSPLYADDGSLRPLDPPWPAPAVKSSFVRMRE